MAHEKNFENEICGAFENEPQGASENVTQEAFRSGDGRE